MKVLLLTLVLVVLVNEGLGACEFSRGREFQHGEECVITIGKVVFQGDGNLVIYNHVNQAKWNSGTAGTGDRLVFQGDGNLVIYNSAGRALWNTRTAGTGFKLVFQDDRNLVIYDRSNRAVWNSKTAISK